MTLEIEDKTIKDIAEWLDMGMVCFYHKASGEIEYYPDELRNPAYDEETWAEAIDKVEKNPNDYLRFEGMHSSAAFKLMEDFISGINHVPTHNRFINAISGKKPFRQFNELISNYPDLQEQWFAYKLECYIEFVKGQIETE
jgi:hypothetical protein